MFDFLFAILVIVLFLLAPLAILGCLVWAIACFRAMRKAARDAQSIASQADYRKARRRLWISCVIEVLLVGLAAYGIVMCLLPWNSARDLDARIQFVKETFVEKSHIDPSEVRLERSDSAKPGESDVYVGVAIVEGKAWDVRVWNVSGELRMEAKRQ